jgi:hypothetical protein
MVRNLEVSKVQAFYLELDLEVEYEAHEPVYGRSEPDSGGLYLGGSSRLSEQIYLKKVLATGAAGQKIDILPLLSEGDQEALIDVIIQERRD